MLFSRSFRPVLIRSPLLYRPMSGSIPSAKNISELMNKEKVPSANPPNINVQESKAEGDAKKWAEGVVKQNEGKGPVQSNPSERNTEVASSPGSSIDLFRQFRPPVPFPSISSMIQPFHSLMPRSIRRQVRAIEDWMNDNIQQSFGVMGGGEGGQGENQLAESDFRDLWYDFDRELSRPVSFTLEDKTDHYIAKLELKGFEKKDLSIRIQENDYLIISGSMNKTEEKDRKDQGKMHRSTNASFTRVLPLPNHIDKSNIKAKYEGNALIVTIPKDKQKIEQGHIKIE